MRRAVAIAVGVLCGIGVPARALAQAADSPGRVEVGIGALWIGSQPLSTRAATETTATTGTSTLFNTASDLASAAGFSGRVGVRLSRRLAVEGEATFTQPVLRVAVSGDAEGAAAVTATETVQQFTVGGGVLWAVPGRWSPRFAPFATAGGGYLRQLHEAATLVETGHYLQFGGGVNALLVSSRRFHTKGIGVRAEVRAVVRSKGVAFDGGSKTSPAAGISLFVRF